MKASNIVKLRVKSADSTSRARDRIVSRSESIKKTMRRSPFFFQRTHRET